MDTILLFKQDLDRYPTNTLLTLQRYLGLPVADRNDLLWLLAIHQAQNNHQGAAYVKPARIQKAEFPYYTPQVKTIAAGGPMFDPASFNDYSLGILEDGTIKIWVPGKIQVYGIPADEIPSPEGDTIKPPPGRIFTQVSAGSMHALGLLDDGHVIGWEGTIPFRLTGTLSGYHNRGQASPPSLPNGRIFTQVSAGGFHSLGLLDDGTIIGWGMGNDGRTLAPKPPDGAYFIQAVAGGTHSLGLLNTGEVMGWGRYNIGEIEPPNPPNNTKFIQIAAGDDYSIGLLDNGQIVGWGDNGYNQIPTERDNPPDGRCFVQIAAGALHTLGLLDDGSIIGWGRNDEGQAESQTPPDGKRFIQIAAGAGYSMGMLDDGNVITWGEGINTKDQPMEKFIVPSRGMIKSAIKK